MVISELIARLQALQAANGDIGVVFRYCADSYSDTEEKVDKVVVESFLDYPASKTSSRWDKRTGEMFVVLNP